MGFRLYEINEALNNFDFEIDEETGEILNADEYEALQIEREEKLEGIGIIIKSIDAENAAYKAEVDNLMLKIKRGNTHKEALTELLKRELKGEKFSTPKVKVVYRRSEAVNIADDHLIPDSYCNIRVERKPDKMLIKKALKEGKEILGASIEERRSLTVK